MRRLMRDIAEGRALGDVTTLRDPAFTAQPRSVCGRLQAAGGLSRRLASSLRSRHPRDHPLWARAGPVTIIDRWRSVDSTADLPTAVSPRLAHP